MFDNLSLLSVDCGPYVEMSGYVSNIFADPDSGPAAFQIVQNESRTSYIADRILEFSCNDLTSC
jgi:hypothetical protein